MAREASTARNGKANRGMRTTLLIVVVLGIVFAAIGLLALGVFPPAPRTVEIDKILPTDHLAAH